MAYARVDNKIEISQPFKCTEQTKQNVPVTAAMGPVLQAHTLMSEKTGCKHGFKFPAPDKKDIESSDPYFRPQDGLERYRIDGQNIKINILIGRRPMISILRGRKCI